MRTTTVSTHYLIPASDKVGNRGVDDSGCPGSNSWTLSGVAEGYEPGDLFGQTVAVSADGVPLLWAHRATLGWVFRVVAR